MPSHNIVIQSVNKSCEYTMSERALMGYYIYQLNPQWAEWFFYATASLSEYESYNDLPYSIPNVGMDDEQPVYFFIPQMQQFVTVLQNDIIPTLIPDDGDLVAELGGFDWLKENTYKGGGVCSNFHILAEWEDLLYVEKSWHKMKLEKLIEVINDAIANNQAYTVFVDY